MPKKIWASRAWKVKGPRKKPGPKPSGASKAWKVPKPPGGIPRSR